jgi:hypothetical protein
MQLKKDGIKVEIVDFFCPKQQTEKIEKVPKIETPSQIMNLSDETKTKDTDVDYLEALPERETPTQHRATELRENEELMTVKETAKRDTNTRRDAERSPSLTFHDWQLGYGLFEAVYQERGYAFSLSGSIREFPNYRFLFSSGWFIGLSQQHIIATGRARIDDFKGTLYWEQYALLGQGGYQLSLFDRISINGGVLLGWSESRFSYKHQSSENVYFSETTKQGKVTSGWQLSCSLHLSSPWSFGIRSQQMLQDQSFKYDDKTEAKITSQQASSVFLRYIYSEK